MGILTTYIERQRGLKRLGCLDMARGLMRGDAARFKAGYTAENAYIAVVETAGREGIALAEGDREFIAGRLDIAAERRAELEGMVDA